MTGALTGANSTLDHWAQAIGGTAAHEAGHTYGLAPHRRQPAVRLRGSRPGSAPGEDSFKRHLMPAGCNLDGQDRTTYRRHFSDRTFGLLATNVGLSIQTMHNWDLVNPNAAAAHSLTIDFLSPQPTVSIDWTWNGPQQPVDRSRRQRPAGHRDLAGADLQQATRITWSTPNPAWGGTPGVLPGGAQFHVGATFTGVDFNQPDPIIIQNITLFDAELEARSPCTPACRCTTRARWTPRRRLRAALLPAGRRRRAADAAERGRLPAPARRLDRVDDRRRQARHLRRPADHALVGQPVRGLGRAGHGALRARQPRRPAARRGDRSASASRGSTTAANGVPRIGARGDSPTSSRQRGPDLRRQLPRPVPVDHGLRRSPPSSIRRPSTGTPSGGRWWSGR